MLQAWAPVGMHKYHSFMEYVQLYPEYDFIFLGDNGQGDAMCADRVIEKSGTAPINNSSFASSCICTRAQIGHTGFAFILLLSGETEYSLLQ